MSPDYLVPLLICFIMLAAPGVLLAAALRQRSGSTPLRPAKTHTYQSQKRQAYHLSRARVFLCITASLFSALAAGLGMAIWLPLAPAENALLATLASPLFWAAVLVFLLPRTSWRRDCCFTLAASALVLTTALLPLAGG